MSHSSSMRKRVFLRAIKILKNSAWLQDNYGSPQDRAYCAVGAIRRAAELEKAKEYVDYENSTLIEFNDKPGRTKSEVLAKLRELAG